MQDSTKSTFLNMIKNPCVNTCKEYRIIPSLMASLAIIISNWGTTKHFYNTRNVYLLPVDKDWFGKCYDSITGIVYDDQKSCTSGNSLYRVYDDHQKSVEDFISHIASSKRSEDGPLRYESVIGCYEYKEALDKLVRAGFLQDYLSTYDDQELIGKMISIIEKNHLYEWDNLLKEEEDEMSKKKHYKQQNTNVENNETFQKAFAEEHMYRVRLEWDKPDTQIFASPSYNDCREEALKHEGYKIFIDDDGELFDDPWIVEEVDEPDDGPKPIIHPIPGSSITLNNEPLYSTAIAKVPFAHLSCTVQFYDNNVINGRAKVTVKYEANPKKRDPSTILGYINI